MTKQEERSIREDFEAVKDRLEQLVPKDWNNRSCIIPFLTRGGVPVSVRYGIKDKRFIEINVISEDNKLEYIKL